MKEYILFQCDGHEEFRTVEVGFGSVDRCPGEEVGICCEIGTFVEVALKFDRLSFIFYSYKVERNGNRKIPGEKSFNFVKRACSA